MKTATLAAVLNFLIPGAGLWYLGMRVSALINLCLATALIVLLSGAGSTSDHIHYVTLAVAAGSAGLAHALARQRRMSAQ